MLQRRLHSAHRLWRQARVVARSLHAVRHPVLAQIVVTRRCNLSCAYCNEFDSHSVPVPTDELIRRVDALAALGTGMVDLSGGEPLLHPAVDAIIARIRTDDMLAGLLTNGYLLSRERIDALNRAGLDHLQISIDNARPDAVSKKSLSVLDAKLQLLARHATFAVNINSVLGGALQDPQAALLVAKRAVELGFSATVGLIHDAHGALIPLTPVQRAACDEIIRLARSPYSVSRQNRFQENLARGLPNAWHCRAGSRYLYVCEDGLVHWCSQQRGYPAIPLSAYSATDLDREFHTEKRCAPYCTVSCVHRVALVDQLRERPVETMSGVVSSTGDSAAAVRYTVRLLRWMFMDSRRRAFFRHAALRLLRVR